MAYFSNGCEGETLDNQCSECPIGKHPDAPCPVLLVQSLYNYKQVAAGNEELRAAMNLLIDENGVCQMKPVLEKFVTANPAQRFDRKHILPSMLPWAEARGIV
jgi:hypothetical protein